MSEQKIHLRWGIVAFTVFLVSLTRLVPHAFALPGMFNISPIGGMALFGAAYFSRKYMAFLLPMLALWISNLLLDNLFYTRYYDGFAWFSNWEVYLAFALIVALGSWMFKKISAGRVLGASLSASILFFLVTNFFVWSGGTMYSKNLGGLVACYINAIPFFWNTLAGDLFYAALLFGVFEWMKRQYPALLLERP